MIFQDPMTSLNPVLTVGRQLIESIRRHESMSVARARQRALDLLRRVHIPDPERRLDDYPHQLSGGMNQRVMIAMAIACTPKLLIADEPTTALDVTIQAQILGLMQELQRDFGMALIIITHDLGVVADGSDALRDAAARRQAHRDSRCRARPRLTAGGLRFRQPMPRSSCPMLRRQTRADDSGLGPASRVLCPTERLYRPCRSCRCVI
jgi:ABC-type oligopeptide transport system ATPase subunit